MRNIRVNIKPLEVKIKRYKTALKKEAKPILMQSALRGAETAMRWAPPPAISHGARSIPQKDYYRKGVFNIFGALKGGFYKTLYKGKLKRYATEFRKKLEQGYRYFVYKDTKKNSKVWYFKNRRQAQKYLRIKYRGLLKMMYGLDLLNQGYVSTAFQRLIKKSPALKTLTQLSKIEYRQQQDYYNITNHNKAISETLASVGKNKSKKPIKSTLKKLLNEFKKRIF